MRSLKQAAKRSVAITRLLGPPSAFKLWARSALQGARRDSLELIHPPHCSTGIWIRPSGSDLDVVMQIFLKRDYDLSWDAPYDEHIRTVSERIRGDGYIPVIVDAGANIGASTLWFSLRFPDCHVFAIEPDAGNFAVLARNVAGRSNVTVLQAGLWDRSTNLGLVSETDDGWGRRVGEEEAGERPTIASVTIPELLERDPRYRPLIVKIDIEGAETAVFRSNTEWADTVPLVIFEPHDDHWHWLGTWQSTAHAFFSVLTRRKREYLLRGENVFAFLHPEPV